MNIHLALTSGKKLYLVECVGSLGIFYWLFVRFFFSSFPLFSGWVNRRDYGQLLSVAIADFLFKQYFTPTDYCVAVM